VRLYGVSNYNAAAVDFMRLNEVGYNRISRVGQLATVVQRCTIPRQVPPA
jgi:hypothetical protein